MLIKFCRIAGLSLDDILLIIADESTDRVLTKRLAAEQLRRIEMQLSELDLARRMMQAASTCSCAAVDDCQCGALSPILTELRGQLGSE